MMYQDMGSFSSQNSIDAYRAASNTLPPIYQIVMLYDGVIGFLRKAKDAIRGKRIEERHLFVRKAQTIVDGLQSCLDHERGGAAAGELDRFYTAAFLSMSRIDLRNDAKVCDEMIAKFTDLRAAWAQLAGRGQPAANAQAAMPAQAARPAAAKPLSLSA